MQQVNLRPGETVIVVAHKDPRYSQEPATSYLVSTPNWGQDDGWDGNLLIELGSFSKEGLSAIGGRDREDLDFGDPTEQKQVEGKVIRLAPQHE